MSTGYVSSIALDLIYFSLVFRRSFLIDTILTLQLKKTDVQKIWNIWKHSYKPRDIWVSLFRSYLIPETQPSINLCSFLQLIKRLVKGNINVPFIPIFRGPILEFVQLGTVPWSCWFCVYKAYMEHKIRWRKTWYESEKLLVRARAHIDNSCWYRILDLLHAVRSCVYIFSLLMLIPAN